MKYTTPGGQIWLAARQEESEVVFSIRDTGLGIPTDMLTRVFDIFAQVDQTLTRSQGGLGIGLTLTKSFVEMHGGRIEVHSDGHGQGSEFVVHLPATPGNGRYVASKTASQARSVSLPTLRILVVDDTRAAGYVLGKLLEKLGQTVRTVGDAATALETVRVEQPDLVISDIGMPHMDGYEFARRLRKLPGLETLPIVAITGYGQESDKKRAKEAGFNYHLTKPVSLEALQNLLTSFRTFPGEGDLNKAQEGRSRN